VLPTRSDDIGGGEFLNDLDIGDKGGACEDAFEQVVTQNGRFWNAADQRSLECVDVVDAFAGEGPLAI
jgi:hypothetical protein